MNQAESRRHLVDTAATSFGILAIAVTSAVEVLLFLHRFGTTQRTDGVFAAFALYTLVTVFAQILRTSSVPLVTGDDAPLRVEDFAAALGAMAAAIAVVGVAVAQPLADVLARSTTGDGRVVAATSLRLLAPAMALQVLAAGMAVIAARAGRLRAVGLAYVVANGCGLVAFLVLASSTGESVLAWCVLIGSAALIPCLVPATGWSIARPGRVRELARAAGLVVRSAAVPVTFVGLYPISIALAGDVPAGEITRFAFAYTVCSYLPGLTSVALSMTDIAGLSVAENSATSRARIATRSARWSALLIAPVVAVAAAVGPRLFDAIQPGSQGAGDLGRQFVLLGPWLAATVLLWSTLPALLAETRGSGLVPYVPVLVAVHVGATLFARWWWDFDGVVVALAVAPLLMALASWRHTGVLQRAPALVASVAQAALVGACVYGALTPLR